MENATILILAIGASFLSLFLGYAVGSALENRHYRSIHKREDNLLHIPAVSWRRLDDNNPVKECRLVYGSVVVSADHFKRFLMGLRQIFGGEIRSYSPLFDRGRREALLRMKESCPEADLFLNCRLETATISSGKSKSTGCVEIVAYGTAIMFEK